MIVKIDFGALTRSKWFEYLLRFVLGGLISAAAAAIAKSSGPEIGGLFLAFPAILPAAATLIAKHERQKKAKRGLRGELRGKQAAGADAAGAAMGSFGLAAFGGVAWWCIPATVPALALAAALLAWMLVATLIWAVWKYHHRWTT